MRADLWRIHESLSSELAERRARAGVMVLVDVGILAAVVAFVFVDPLASQNQGPLIRIGYLAIVVYQGACTILAFVAVNPGLPWERKPFVHFIAWLASRVVGASLDKEAADRFEPLYRGHSVAWTRFRSNMRRDGDDAPRVRRAIEQLDAAEISVSIAAPVYEIEQQRSWRRFVAIASLAGFALSASAVLIALAGLLKASSVEVICAGAAATIPLLVVVLIVRAIRSDIVPTNQVASDRTEP